VWFSLCLRVGFEDRLVGCLDSCLDLDHSLFIRGLLLVPLPKKHF
jgi:hypothetical protein